MAGNSKENFMGLERWAVLPGDKIGTEERFILQFHDLPDPRTQPFVRTSGPMTEAELRLELRQLDVSDAAADAAIAQARVEREHDAD
jgi:hypothetical protein